MPEKNSRFSRRKVLKSAGIASGSSLVVGSASAVSGQQNKQTRRNNRNEKDKSEGGNPENVPPKPKEPKSIKEFNPHNPHHVVYVAEEYNNASKEKKGKIENILSEKQKQAIIDAHKPTFTVVKSFSNKSRKQLPKSDSVDKITGVEVHPSERKIINKSVNDKWGWYDEL